MEDRCRWCGKDPQYQQYHDTEWGVPCDNDRKLFEFLILESAQAGLSWLTILRKRDGYRKAFANFDPIKVSKFDQAKIESLIENPAIVRHRKKIESAVNNAQRFLEVQKEFGSFSRYLWSFYQNQPKQNRWKTLAEMPATTSESDAISKNMKKRGFRFFGSTTCYAYLQALGFVNDHMTNCPRHKTCAEIGKQFHANGPQ